MNKIKSKIQEKIQKGKDWCWENRGTVGYIAGGAVTTLLIASSLKVMDKIFEPKKARYRFKEYDDGSMQLGILTTDRFGNETPGDGVLYPAETDQAKILKKMLNILIESKHYDEVDD